MKEPLLQHPDFPPGKKQFKRLLFITLALFALSAFLVWGIFLRRASPDETCLGEYIRVRMNGIVLDVPRKYWPVLHAYDRGGIPKEPVTRRVCYREGEPPIEIRILKISDNYGNNKELGIPFRYIDLTPISELNNNFAKEHANHTPIQPVKVNNRQTKGIDGVYTSVYKNAFTYTYFEHEADPVAHSKKLKKILQSWEIKQ